MFNEQEYREKMKELCGNPKDCKFPDSYFGNIRIWDYASIIDNGDLKDTDAVLECGSLHSYFCVYASQKVAKYVVGDSFYWAKRDYCQNQHHYQSPEEWCQYVMTKGQGKIVAEEADIQKLPYSDNSFDKVISISTIEHVHEDRIGMLELIRVLKPGGLLLLTTEFNPSWSKSYEEDKGGYYRVYDIPDLFRLCDGLNLVQSKVSDYNFLPPGQFATIFLKIVK